MGHRNGFLPNRFPCPVKRVSETSVVKDTASTTEHTETPFGGAEKGLEKWASRKMTVLFPQSEAADCVPRALSSITFSCSGVSDLNRS